MQSSSPMNTAHPASRCLLLMSTSTSRAHVYLGSRYDVVPVHIAYSMLKPPTSTIPLSVEGEPS